MANEPIPPFNLKDTDDKTMPAIIQSNRKVQHLFEESLTLYY